MAWKVEIDVANLESYNTELKTELDKLFVEIQDLSSLIASMRNYWNGDAAEAYIRLMEKRLSTAKDVYLALAEVRFAVKTQVAELKEVDDWFEKAAYEIWQFWH